MMWPTFLFFGLVLGRWGVAVGLVLWAVLAVTEPLASCGAGCHVTSLGLALGNAVVGALVHEFVVGRAVHRLVADAVHDVRNRSGTRAA